MRTLLVMAVFLSVPAYAQSCPGPQTLVLVDATTEWDDKDRADVQSSMKRIAVVTEGDRVTIATVGATASDSKILLDGCVPTDEMDWAGLWSAAWAGELSAAWEMANADGVQRSATQRAFIGELRTAIESITTGALELPEYPATALLATLSTHASAADHIWLLSDLLESAALPAERLIAGAELPDVRLKSGVTVHAAGHGRWHDKKRRDLTDDQERALLEVWRDLVERSGGTFVAIE